MSMPKELESLLENMECILDDEGKSKAQVKKYYDRNKVYYLKIEQVNSEVERESGMYQWLRGKLPVSAIVYQAIIENISYLLMEKADGKMLEDEEYKNYPELLVRLAAKGINRLKGVDISDCIYNSAIEYKLMKAREFIDHGIAVNIDESIYTKGMSTVEDVYRYLVEHKPDEELVFTHGDYCFNNYFTDGMDITGYIDMGRAVLSYIDLVNYQLLYW